MKAGNMLPALWNRAVAAGTLAVFALQVTGCESLFERDPVRDGFQSLTQLLEKEGSGGAEPTPELKAARAVQSAIEKADQVLADEPDFGENAPTTQAGATEFVHRNRAKISARLKALESGSEPFRKVIYEESRRAYETRDPKVEAQADALVYYALELQRAYHRKAVEAVMPYLVYTASVELRKVAEIAELNKEATDSYFRHFGAQIVSQKDRKEVLSSLRELKKDGGLPKEIEVLIDRTQEAMAAKSQGASASMTEKLGKMSKDEQAQLSQSAKNLVEQFEGVSFLYSPEQNLNPLLDLLVIIGNLTWGMVNTMIGAGIVVWTMALSVTGLVRFPRFAVAQNGRMIYVDVTGSNPLGLYGKMSMGLFELDNGTGYSFASGHEGVHAIQSAVLGPFYIPVILFTYMVSGFDRGFMEEWADAWAGI